MALLESWKTNSLGVSNSRHYPVRVEICRLEPTLHYTDPNLLFLGMPWLELRGGVKARLVFRIAMVQAREDFGLSAMWAHYAGSMTDIRPRYTGTAGRSKAGEGSSFRIRLSDIITL